MGKLRNVYNNDEEERGNGRGRRVAGLRVGFTATVMVVAMAMAMATECAAQGLDDVPDATCSRGLCAGPVCCPAACGSCGGAGCQARPLAAQCCAGWVKRRARSCSRVGPPCTVDKPLMCGSVSTVPTPRPPTPSPLPGTGGPGAEAGVGEWRTITDELRGTPTPRHEACFVMMGGRGYLIGGRGTRAVERFDPATGSWEAVAPMPTQMHHMQCVPHEGLIYVPTSWYGGSPSESVNALMWVFHTSNNTWSSLPGLPEARRRGAAASVLFQNKIWVIAGNRGGHGPPSQSLGWMDYYDLRTRRWRTSGLASLPAGHERDHAGAAVVKGRICIAGGRNGGMPNPFAAVVPSTLCYDVRRNSWVDMGAPLPFPRAGAATARTCAGALILAGGEARFSRAFDSVHVFNGVSWASLPPLNRARHGTGLAVANCNSCNHIFIASGSGARGGRPELESTELYIPPGGPVRCTKY